MIRIRHVFRRIQSAVWLLHTRLYVSFLRLLGLFPGAQTPSSSGTAVYLTFDDGPGAYTPRLLAILDRYRVKATFFVTTGARHPEHLPAIAAAGHTVGNHTALHHYRRLYADEASFRKALEEMETIILEKTGRRPSLLRFPGGSGSIDFFAAEEGLAQRLPALAAELGYRCIDWDLDSGDTAGARSPGAVYRRVTRGLRRGEDSIVLLHDIKKHSVDALELILVWGLRHGFVFRPLE